MADLLPARIRRLTNAEYDAAVQRLLGTSSTPAAGFSPDARQHGYTVNEAQRVDPVLARQLDAVAQTLAAEAVERLDEIAPCDDPDASGETCAASFIEDFGRRAYRRPLDAVEKEGLLGLYRAGATDASYAEGVAHVIRGVLQSPGFLYVTEIGDGSEEGTVELTPHETASALSFLFSGAPPDAELLAAAEAGELSGPDAREAQARRLLETPQGRVRLVQIVRQWLGLDRIASTAKDSNVYPDYADLQAAMQRETAAFVEQAIAENSGHVSTLLGADWTVAEEPLAAMYGATGAGRVETPNRRGLLNQAAFLSVYAHAHETAPVLRGTAVLRRVACIDIEIPTSLDLVIVPPVPDPEKTTRERFSIHSEDASCKSCHSLIDPLGFSFEQFDGMGAYREQENGKPVDSSGDVAVGFDFDGVYQDSNELAVALSGSSEVATCFARQVFRASAAEGSGAEQSEETFLAGWQELPADLQGSLVEVLVAFSRSSLFTHRKEQ